jgi:hypothetical protein
MKLIVDYDCGEGEVVLSQKFINQDSGFRVDVLQDWINILQGYYADAQKEFYSEMDGAKPLEPTR